jgi:hypothetical protein
VERSGSIAGQSGRYSGSEVVLVFGGGFLLDLKDRDDGRKRKFRVGSQNKWEREPKRLCFGFWRWFAVRSEGERDDGRKRKEKEEKRKKKNRTTPFFAPQM